MSARSACEQTGGALETEPLSPHGVGRPSSSSFGPGRGSSGPRGGSARRSLRGGGGQPPPGVRERARGRAVPALHPRRRELLRGDADGRQRGVLGRGRPAAPESGDPAGRARRPAVRHDRAPAGRALSHESRSQDRRVSDGRGEGPNPTALAQSLRRLLRPRLALRLGRSRRRGVRGGRRGGAAPSRRGPARELHRPRRPAPHVGLARSIRGADERGRDAVAQRLGRGEPPGPSSHPTSICPATSRSSPRTSRSRSTGARPPSAGRGRTSTC